MHEIIEKLTELVADEIYNKNKETAEHISKSAINRYYSKCTINYSKIFLEFNSPSAIITHCFSRSTFSSAHGIQNKILKINNYEVPTKINYLWFEIDEHIICSKINKKRIIYNRTGEIWKRKQRHETFHHKQKI